MSSVTTGRPESVDGPAVDGDSASGAGVFGIGPLLVLVPAAGLRPHLGEDEVIVRLVGISSCTAFSSPLYLGTEKNKNSDN